jgi:RHS repeat-associated protein
VGSGCTNLQETYVYNNRLQMAVAEIGTSGTHAADSCRVYNYYVGATNASACSESPSGWPTGTNDNGNVAGYFYSDTMNSGLSHSAIYGYDAVNRLTSAAATGNYTYSQAFTFDAFGNMACSGSGPGCVAPTYNSANNQSSYDAYDAAGHVTADGGLGTYTWDAEGHLAKVSDACGGTMETYTYNALGQLAESRPYDWGCRFEYGFSSLYYEYVYGASGNELGLYTLYETPQWQEMWVDLGGRPLAEYTGSVTYFPHPDRLGTVGAASDYTGTVVQDAIYYPFGSLATHAGIIATQQFASMREPTLSWAGAGYGYYITPNRLYDDGLTGRWVTPDPGGLKVVELDDPQTWNMYAYVRNNPTTLTDPTGLAPPEGCTSGVNSDETCNVPANAGPAAINAANAAHTSYKETVMAGVDHTIIVHQVKTETIDLKDSNGNVIDHKTKTTVTDLTYSLKGDQVHFLGGEQREYGSNFKVPPTIFQDEKTALAAYGGSPSRIYETFASIIRDDGAVKFGATVVSGALASPEIGAAAVQRNLLSLGWEILKEAVVEHFIQH